MIGYNLFSCFFSSDEELPYWMRVRVITPDCRDDPAWFLPFPDGDLIVTLRQHRTLVDVVHKDGDGCRGCGAIATADQTHRVLGTDHQDVLTLPLKVQHLDTG